MSLVRSIRDQLRGNLHDAAILGGLLVGAVVLVVLAALGWLSLGYQVLLWALLPLALFSVARTHHHWYLDPTYPAWAIIAAFGCLALMRYLEQRGRTLLPLCLIATALLACEVRFTVWLAERNRGARKRVMSRSSCESS